MWTICTNKLSFQKTRLVRLVRCRDTGRIQFQNNHETFRKKENTPSTVKCRPCGFRTFYIHIPKCSMYGIFAYMYHNFKPNVGKIPYMEHTYIYMYIPGTYLSSIFWASNLQKARPKLQSKQGAPFGLQVYIYIYNKIKYINIIGRFSFQKCILCILFAKPRTSPMRIPRDGDFLTRPQSHQLPRDTEQKP